MICSKSDEYALSKSAKYTLSSLLCFGGAWIFLGLLFNQEYHRTLGLFASIPGSILLSLGFILMMLAFDEDEG
jgi:hypothetical protein